MRWAADTIAWCILLAIDIGAVVWALWFYF
jgi:hypothetical protein